ncbi:hypothetical protein CCMA1212_008056 [Trichoderma ghanense]|uniref:Uncharacterized protein n=1 Tax=Trichoderma ghanense TaxID=65468 RepID=A0ABY2GV24_9HYPO
MDEKFQRTPLLTHSRLTRREHRINMWPREAGARMPEHGHAMLQTDRQGFEIMLPRRMLGEREAPSDNDSALFIWRQSSPRRWLLDLLSIMSRLFKTLPCQPCLLSCFSRPTPQKRSAKHLFQDGLFSGTLRHSLGHPRSTPVHNMESVCICGYKLLNSLGQL